MAWARPGPGRDYVLRINQMHEMKRLYVEELWSQQEIADHFGVCRAAIQNAMRFMGVQPRGQLEGRLLLYRRNRLSGKSLRREQ